MNNWVICENKCISQNRLSNKATTLILYDKKQSLWKVNAIVRKIGNKIGSSVTCLQQL